MSSSSGDNDKDTEETMHQGRKREAASPQPSRLRPRRRPSTSSASSSTPAAPLCLHDEGDYSRPIGGSDDLNEKLRPSVDTSINAADVLCGRDKTSFNHSGNKRFRDAVSSSLEAYMQADSRFDKAAVVHKIVDDIRKEGGRFLKKSLSSGRWVPLSDQQAKEKVGHATRDAVNAYENRQIKVRKKGYMQKEVRNYGLSSSSLATSYARLTTDDESSHLAALSKLPNLHDAISNLTSASAAPNTYPQIDTVISTADSIPILQQRLQRDQQRRLERLLEEEFTMQHSSVQRVRASDILFQQYEQHVPSLPQLSALSHNFVTATSRPEAESRLPQKLSPFSNDETLGGSGSHSCLPRLQLPQHELEEHSYTFPQHFDHVYQGHIFSRGQPLPELDPAVPLEVASLTPTITRAQSGNIVIDSAADLVEGDSSLIRGKEKEGTEVIEGNDQHFLAKIESVLGPLPPDAEDPMAPYLDRSSEES